MKSRLYEALEQAVPYPYVVGGVAMLVGVGQAWTTFRRGIVGRWVAAFCAGSFFFLIMNALQRVDDSMPGLVLYSSFSVMNLLTMGLLFRRQKLA